MSSLPVQNNTKELLPAVYYEMFGYRMAGLTYKQIAERTGYSESHTRLLFSKNGVLHKFWRSWVEDRKSEVIDQVSDMEFGHLEDIVRQNILDAKRPDSMVAVIARKMIFDRTRGPVQQNVKITGTLATMSFTEWMRLQTEKINDESKRSGVAESDPVQNESIVVPS